MAKKPRRRKLNQYKLLASLLRIFQPTFVSILTFTGCSDCIFMYIYSFFCPNMRHMYIFAMISTFVKNKMPKMAKNDQKRPKLTPFQPIFWLCLSPDSLDHKIKNLARFMGKIIFFSPSLRGAAFSRNLKNKPKLRSKIAKMAPVPFQGPTYHRTFFKKFLYDQNVSKMSKRFKK